MIFHFFFFPNYQHTLNQIFDHFSSILLMRKYHEIINDIILLLESVIDLID